MLHFALQMTLTPEYNREEAIHSFCFINNHLDKGAMSILKRLLNSLKHLVTLDFQWRRHPVLCVKRSRQQARTKGRWTPPSHKL